MLRISVWVCFFTVLFLSFSEADPRKAYEYNEQGVVYLKEKKYKAAIDRFKKALREVPENKSIKKNLAYAYNNYGFSFQKQGQTINAIENFKRAVENDPENVYAYLNLAQAYYDNNQMDKAHANILKAENIDPFFEGLKEFRNKLEKEKVVEKDLRRIETVHFLIISNEDVDVDELANIRIVLEQAYSRVGSFYSLFPKEKLAVVLYGDNAYEKALGKKPYWVMASYDGKIRIPLASKKYSKESLRKIIYHEYTHSLMHYITKGNIPIWLNEGLATYSESFVVSRDKSFFKEFINKKTFVPFEKLPLDYSQIRGSAYANLIYREFFLIASFLLDKYGASEIKAILEDLGAGKDIRKIFEKKLKLSYNEFGKEWKKYVFSKLSI